MRRKSFMQRKSPLRRGPWRKKGKPKKVSSYRKRERYSEYMLSVKRMPCIARTMGVPPPASQASMPGLIRDWPCFGEVQADHCGTRAMGRKAHDNTVAPLCRTHHDQKTNGWGLFYGYTLAEKRAWRIAAIAFTQAMAREREIEVPSGA